MTSKSLQKDLLNAVEIINSKLVDRIERSPDGVFWKTMGLGPEGKVVWESGDNLYGGVAGIAIYFLRQYKAFGNEKHLQLATDALNWAVARFEAGEPGSNAFLTGDIGVGLAILELEQLKTEKGRKEKAIKMIMRSAEVNPDDFEICDYINGTAGRIHGLLHAQQLTGNSELLTKIDLLAEDLLKRSWLTKTGLYWDRSGQQVCGLCGLSHGAGGIGYVFMELARYFNNPALNLITRQALSYEDGYFNRKTNNWPDLRRGSYTPEELESNKNEFKKGNTAYFERRNDMNAWCHGAAGIGLVRLDAYRNLGDKKFLKDSKAAIKKTVQTDLKREDPKVTYTLCHGSGGNAELFIRAFEVLEDQKQLKNAGKVVRAGVEFYNREGYYASGYAQGASTEDLSLFMGIAGVGYFYLRTLYPEKFPSLLIPSLTGKPFGKAPATSKFLNLKEVELKKIIFANYFEETLQKLGKRKVFDESASGLFKSFDEALKKSLKEYPDKELKQIYQREKKTFEFDLKGPSHALLAIKNIVQSELEPKAVELDREYQLDKDVMLLPTDEELLLIGRNSKGLQEDVIPMFTYQVLKAFSKAEKAGKVIQKISSLFGELSHQEQIEVNQAIESQIHEAVNSGKLIAL